MTLCFLVPAIFPHHHCMPPSFPDKDIINQRSGEIKREGADVPFSLLIYKIRRLGSSFHKFIPSFLKLEVTSFINLSPCLNSKMPAANKTTMTGTGNEENIPQQQQALVEYIKLILIGQDSTEVHFRVKNSVEIGKLKTAYAERIGVPAGSLLFLFDGRLVQDEDTPQSRTMKDGDVIAVFQEHQSAEYIKLKLIGLDSHEWHFRVKKSVSMGKLKAAYAKVLGAPAKGVIYIDNTNCAVKADDVRFLFNGRRVKDEDTPLSRKMKDGDSINVFQEQELHLPAEECLKKTLIVIGPDSREWHFRVKYSTSMGKLKAAYAEIIGVPADSFQFMFDGRRVKDGDTPLSRKIKDGDSINVVQP